MRRTVVALGLLALVLTSSGCGLRGMCLRGGPCSLRRLNPFAGHFSRVLPGRTVAPPPVYSTPVYAAPAYETSCGNAVYSQEVVCGNAGYAPTDVIYDTAAPSMTSSQIIDGDGSSGIIQTSPIEVSPGVPNSLPSSGSGGINPNSLPAAPPNFGPTSGATAPRLSYPASLVSVPGERRATVVNGPEMGGVTE